MCTTYDWPTTEELTLELIIAEGRLRRFFAARALVPISRLTYCAYLTNGLVELYHAGTVRTAKFLSITNLVSLVTETVRV